MKQQFVTSLENQKANHSCNRVFENANSQNIIYKQEI